MPTRNASNLILWTLLLALLIAACGTLQLNLEGQETPASGEGENAPALEVLVARDTALAYLRGEYTDQAPATDLVWQVERTTPEGLVGGSSFEFKAANWLISISYPIVAPEAVVYTIEVSSGSGFTWSGTVDVDGRVTSLEEDGGPIQVVGWLGHFASLPQGMAQDDAFILGTAGTASFDIMGQTEAVQQEIVSLRDAVGRGEFVNVWGVLDCDPLDPSRCTLTVDRLLYGAQSEIKDTVDGWEGVIYSGPPGPRSGGDDYFVLVGPYPVEYGIWAMDEGVRAELEAVRDSGQVIRIYGSMLSGVPDWNNTQIQVERFERIETPNADIPTAPNYPEVKQVEGWLTYTNDRYGYEIQYPPEVTLNETGVMGYPSDENGNPVGGLPEGVTLDTYFTYLEQTYGTNLCLEIKTSLGYITISVPENAGAKFTPCGRTGVGAATITEFELPVRVDGKDYSARGMDIQAGGESLVDHNETVYLTMDDGTRVEFGARPIANATFDDYLMKGRPLLLSILETYQNLR